MSPIGGVIGVDVGARYLRAARVDRAGCLVAAVGVHRTGEGALPDAADARRLAAALRRGGVRGRCCWLTIPKAVAGVHGMTLPTPAPGVPLQQIARAEVTRIARGLTGGFEFALWLAPIPHRSEGVHATAVTLAHERADALMGAFESAGFDVLGVTPVASAIARNAADADDPGALGFSLDLGWTDTMLVAHRAGRPLFQRSLPVSQSRVVMALAERLEMQPAEAETILRAPPPADGPVAEAIADVSRAFGDRLGDELNASLHYLRSMWPGEPPASFSVFGGGSALAGVDGWIVGATGVAVRRPDGAPAPFATALGAARIAQSEKGALAA